MNQLTSKPITINNTGTFEEEVVRSDLPVLADFWASWCAPCRMIAPIVEELAGEFAGTLKVVKIDVDANPELASRYEVWSIPTLGLFRGGELVQRFIGYQPKAALQQKLQAALG